MRYESKYLEHSNAGNLVEVGKKIYKYIRKIRKPDGSFRYIYNESKTPSSTIDKNTGITYHTDSNGKKYAEVNGTYVDVKYAEDYKKQSDEARAKRNAEISKQIEAKKKKDREEFKKKLKNTFRKPTSKDVARILRTVY